MAALRQCHSVLCWQRAGGMRRKTRGCPQASCTFSSCRQLRGVACEPPEKRKKKIMQRRPDRAGAGAERRGFAEKKGNHLLVRASTPGSLRPPRNSSEAPPPVEMCEILPATPDWWTAATESP